MQRTVHSLTLKPARSARLLLALCAMHLLGLTALAIGAIDPLARAVLIAAICGSLAWQLRSHFWLGGKKPEMLVWQPSGDWLIHPSENRYYRARRWELWVNLPWLSILRFHDGAGRRLTVVLCPDSLPPQVYRQLRVRLTTWSS